MSTLSWVVMTAATAVCAGCALLHETGLVWAWRRMSHTFQHAQAVIARHAGVPLAFPVQGINAQVRSVANLFIAGHTSAVPGVQENFVKEGAASSTRWPVSVCSHTFAPSHSMSTREFPRSSGAKLVQKWVCECSSTYVRKWRTAWPPVFVAHHSHALRTCCPL